MNNYGLLVIDEIPLIGSRKLDATIQKLQAIKHICNKSFAHIDISFARDFYQTPPVHDTLIFRRP